MNMAYVAETKVRPVTAIGCYSKQTYLNRQPEYVNIYIHNKKRWMFKVGNANVFDMSSSGANIYVTTFYFSFLVLFLFSLWFLFICSVQDSD